MGIEEKIKRSFANLKKDIDDIKSSIETLKKELKSTKEIKQKNNSIYTSKPFVNYDMLESVREVFESGMFSMGEKVREFEKRFAEFTNTKNAIAVSSGTAAIQIVLESIGIKKDDEIIVPSFTTMPTIEPILQLGAKPIFVDIDKKTYTIDIKKIEKSITRKTKAIMPVHLYGNPADIKQIKKICDKRGLKLIEDCAQAHGAFYLGQHVGNFGDAGCFSFYPTKNLTVLGEGGMIITNDDKIAKKCRMIANHGEDGRYNHITIGGNYRLSEIHASIGLKQLELLESFIRRRRDIARQYDKLLNKKKIIIPKETKNGNHCYHLYVIRVNRDKRNTIIERLKKEGIFLGVHYPIPCHKQKAVIDRFGQSGLPITEKISKEIISLPMYPELQDKEISIIAKKINGLV